MARVLFADGEPHIRRLCLEEFQDEGYEVQVAGRGGEVLRLVETFQPDLVILEVLLPDMSGPEAACIVKGTKKDTRIVYCSHALPPRDLSTWCGDGFVVKSHALRPLKETVRRQLLPN